MALGGSQESFGILFFVRQIGSRAFVTLIFLKREKSNLSNIATLYIIEMQILHRFEKTKEPMSENQYLSQYAVGLPYEISWFKKRTKYMTSSIKIHLSQAQKCWLFTKNILVLQKRDLKDLHSHKNIFGQRGLVCHKQ